jgi:hypothetical protein
LTDNLNQIKSTGPADLKLSSETLNQYMAALTTFHSALQTQRTAMNNVGPLGNVGTLTSAQQTSTNLGLDVTGPLGITETTDKYVTYLEDFMTTVLDAGIKSLQSG